jgi:anti-sigma factor RsiW
MMHLSPEALAGYLDDALPREEQGQVELHLATCTPCREELAEVRRLQLHRSRRRWAVVLLPTAAAAAALLVIGLPRPATTPSDIRARPAAEQPLAIVSPVSSAEIAPGPVKFTWGSAGPRASYTLTLQAADGRVVWTWTATDTVAVLPDSVALGPGLTWFWYVDAMLSDGRSRSTGLQRLRTRP